MKIVERQKAVELRKKGLTYTEIGQCLNVSKSSLSCWLREIPYVPTEETTRKRKLASRNNGLVLHRQKIQRINRIKEEAKREIATLKSNELKLLGAMAYWAEGSKTQDSKVKFTNTDPRFIRFAIKWLMKACCVPKEKIHLHIRVHRDTDKENAKKYWSELTDIPKNQFQKTTIKTSGSNGRRHNKLKCGILSVSVYDTNLFYRIMGWIEALVENARL